MRIVLDTNLLVAALARPSGAAAQILRAWRNGRVELVASRETLAEASAVAGRGWLARVVPRESVGALLAELQERAVLVEGLEGAAADLGLKDPGDVRAVEAAVAGGARYVVTSDREFLSKRGHGDVEFVTPGEFLRRLEGSPGQGAGRG